MVESKAPGWGTINAETVHRRLPLVVVRHMFMPKVLSLLLPLTRIQYLVSHDLLAEELQHRYHPGSTLQIAQTYTMAVFLVRVCHL